MVYPPTPMNAVAPMFAGPVMAATGCSYQTAVEALRAHQADYGVKPYERLDSIDYDGWIEAAIGLAQQVTRV